MECKVIALYIYIALLIHCWACGYPPMFATLQEINQYAATHPENPPIDNDSWVNPDYSSYIKSQLPSWWDNLLFKMHIKPWPLWHAQGFADLLERVSIARQNEGYIDRFVMQQPAVYGASYVIWGDLQGAFHSLVRALNELRSWGIINDDLLIIEQNYHLVFNGNAINRSAYSLELLTVLLQLMDKNPKRVFYIRGQYEDQGHWKNFSLKTDLNLRAQSISDTQIPLSQEIDRFFNTLPLALYLVQKEQDSADIVRISYFGRDRQELTEEHFKGFFEHTQNNLVFKLHNEIAATSRKINVKAIIKGQHLNDYRPSVGLSQLEVDRGSTAWSIVSCPTKSYQELQDFYYDVFTVLEIGKQLALSTITLYNQDVRELVGFKQVDTFNIVTGLKIQTKEPVDEIVDLKRRLAKAQSELVSLRASCQMLDDLIQMQREQSNASIQPITVGIDIDLSEISKEIGNNVLDGVQAAFKLMDQMNIDADQTQLVVYDHKSLLEDAKENIRTFLRDYTSAMLLSAVGVDRSYLDLVKEDLLTVFFPITGSSLARKPEYTQIIFFRPSYQQELEIATREIQQTLGIKKMALLHYDDDQGNTLANFMQQLLHQLGVDSLVKIPWQVDELDVDRHIDLIKKEDPSELCFIIHPVMAQHLLQALGMEFLRTKHIYGWSVLSDDLFRQFIKSKGIHCMFVSVVPSLENDAIPLIRKFKQAVKLFNVKEDVFALEGFINASIFMYLVAHASSNITRHALIDVAQNITALNFEGITLRFNPQTRQLSHTLWLDHGNDNWIEKKIEQ